MSKGNNSDLVFDINSVSEFEYKLNSLALLNKEEIKSLGIDDQILFLEHCGLNSTFPYIIVFAPSCWFESKDDFRNKVIGPLRKYLVDTVRKYLEHSIKAVGRFISVFGVERLSSYCCATFEFGPDGECSLPEDEVDDLMISVRRYIKIASLAVKLSYNMPNSLIDWVMGDGEGSIGVIRFNGMDNDMGCIAGEDKTFPTFAIELPLFDTDIYQKDYKELLNEIYKLHTHVREIVWES